MSYKLGVDYAFVIGSGAKHSKYNIQQGQAHAEQNIPSFILSAWSTRPVILQP
jgi:hypothetical protein